MSEHARYLIPVTLVVTLGGFLLGFDASVISGVVKFIEPEFGLSKLALGWAVSSITLTAALGTLIAGPLSDAWGRRFLLICAAVLFTVSAIGSALAPTFFWLIVARLVGGLGIGVALIIAPVYIAEIAPPHLRGRLVSTNQLNIVLGISVAFFTNYLILQLGQSDASWALSLNFEGWNWRWMLGLETLPALGFFLGLFFVPRSPRWLMMQGAEQEARAVMQKFVPQEALESQLEEIRHSLAQENDQPKARMSELLDPRLRLVLVIGLVVGIFQQITGINAVLFYAPIIFEQTGIGTDASFAQAVWVGLTNLVFTVIAMALIDRLGRKPLLTVGMAGMVVCLLVMAYGFYSATYTLTDASLATLPAAIEQASISPLIGQQFNSDLAFKAALVDALGEATAGEFEASLVSAAINVNALLILFALLGFVGAYAASIGPVMWVLFSELFPNRIRGLAISFVGVVNLAVAFTVQLVFPWELANLGSGTTYLIYGLLGVVGFLFIVAKVPETKGKSLEELEAELVHPAPQAV